MRAYQNIVFFNYPRIHLTEPFQYPKTGFTVFHRGVKQNPEHFELKPSSDPLYMYDLSLTSSTLLKTYQGLFMLLVENPLTESANSYLQERDSDTAFSAMLKLLDIIENSHKISQDVFHIEPRENG